MKSIILLVFIIGSGFHCLAQTEEKRPGPASVAYHNYRQYETVPPYGLEKVRQLAK